MTLEEMNVKLGDYLNEYYERSIWLGDSTMSDILKKRHQALDQTEAEIFKLFRQAYDLHNEQ